MKSWYTINDAATLDSPALVIYPERVKANIHLAISMVGDVTRLRPHIKTNKSSGAIKMMIAAGISKFKCATIAEAELLGQCAATDVLLAYQPSGPKLQRFINIINQYPSTKYSCVTDSFSAAMEQSIAFSAAGINLPVYLDLNVGMNRTGIVPGEEAGLLYSFLSSASGVTAAGLHAYDGHIRGEDLDARTQACDEAFDLVNNFKNRLEAAGLQIPVIIAGGSPSFPIHAKRTGIECSPGTFIYWDKGYLTACPEQSFLPAALLITRIVSLPSPGKLCTDLGHKSVGSENEMSRRVFFLNAVDLQPASHSEEHLVADAPPDHTYKVGDILYGLPWHICPTVALYERSFTVENGIITGEWKHEARDRRIQF
jgi:D-serine deaminase-like pyridoxal phosphate-dependent protein